jgi:hypothetical protein
MKRIPYIRKIRTGIMLITGLALGLSTAQVKVPSKFKQEEVPPGVQKVIDETMSGQHAFYKFDRYKVNLGFDSSTRLSDLRAGKPFKIYNLIVDSLRTLDDKKFDEKIPVSKMVDPLEIWEVPVFLHGRCVRLFGVWKTKKNPQWHMGISTNCYPGWQKVLEAWPDSAGYHPLMIYLGSNPKFFHIPEKDDYKLTPLIRYSMDSLDQSADTSFRVLMPSNKVLEYVKKQLPPKRSGGAK